MLVQIDRAHEHASWVHAEWHHPRRTAANAANAEGWLLRPRRHHQHWIRWEIHLPHLGRPPGASSSHHRRRHAHATPHASHASPGWWCHHHPPLATTAGRVHQELWVVRDRGVQSTHRRLLMMMIRGQRAISRRHVFFACVCVCLFLSASSATPSSSSSSSPSSDYYPKRRRAKSKRQRQKRVSRLKEREIEYDLWGNDGAI